MAAGDQYFDSRGVMERFHISERTLHRWMNAPAMEFPKPFRLNRRLYFKVAELERWENAQGAASDESSPSALGMPIVSDVIQSYDDFVAAMRARREALKLPAIEADALGGLQEGYTNKLENWARSYGRGIGPEVFPLWLGGMRVGIVLVDLPRRPYVRRKGRRIAAGVAA